jgi:hypothetical protein
MAETEGRLTRSSPTCPKNDELLIAIPLEKTSSHLLPQPTLQLLPPRMSHPRQFQPIPHYSSPVLPPSTIGSCSTTTPITPSDSPVSLFRLPRELRDYVYTYLSFTEATWIGTPTLVAGQRDVIVEKDTMKQPATFIRTNSSIILVSSEVRDEFRTAVWRSFVKSDRQVDLRLYDFASKPLVILASRFPLDLQKLLEKRKCRVDFRFTEALKQYRTMDQRRFRGIFQSSIVNWVLFFHDVGLKAEHSFDECRWEDAYLVEIAIKFGMIIHRNVLRTDPNVLQIKAAAHKSLQAHLERLRGTP